MNEFLNQSLVELLHAAKQDENLRKKLLATRNSDDPMDSFCNIATEAGFPITIGEMVEMDNALWSGLLKSVNGGATYPFADWGDTYENFLSSL